MASLTPTDLLAAATERLLQAGYARIGENRLDGLNTHGARFFEDQYGVVMLIVYDTWAELGENWTEAQASLVELISSNMTKEDAKAWDGYLVLFTPATCPGSQRAKLEAIRYDTFRVRKLVAAGEELRTLREVERALLPLLPLDQGIGMEEPGSVLELLPDILAGHGIAREATGWLLRAFRDHESLVEALHELEAGK